MVYITVCVSSAGAALPGQLFACFDQVPYEVPCSLGCAGDRVSKIWAGDGHLWMELSAVEYVGDREPHLHRGKAIADYHDRASRALRGHNIIPFISAYHTYTMNTHWHSRREYYPCQYALLF